MTEAVSLELSTLPHAASLVLLALIVFNTYRTWKKSRHIYPSDIIWPAAFVGIEVFLGVWCSNGLIAADPDEGTFVTVSLIIAALGFATMLRRPMQDWLNVQSVLSATLLRTARDVIILVAAAATSAWLIDFVWLETSAHIDVLYVWTTFLIFLAAEFALYALGQRSGILAVLVPAAAFGLGVAQYFVIQFKGVPIMPTDLLALETAAAVGGGYEYILTWNMLVGIGATSACVCALSFVMPDMFFDVGTRGNMKIFVTNIAVNCVAGIALVLGAYNLYNTIKLEEVLEYSYDRWMPIGTYQTLGFVPAFVEIAQDLAIPVPENYSAAAAEETESSLVAQFESSLAITPERQAASTQFEELKPTVIAVMNETFTDLSMYKELRTAGYNGPEFYNSLTGTLQRGSLLVPAFGGGTANSEFEFLTGNSISFIGTGKYPYQLYDLSESDSLAKQFAEIGYTATAMHPENPVNWKRSTAYEQLGFDGFLSIGDFEGAPWYHSGVTDAATYDKILELLMQDAAPQFILDVTMQNHGGYGAGSVPAGDEVNLHVEGIEDGDFYTQLGVYLACIKKSDDDLAYFIEQLSALDRPVVLVFFGDHQPGFSATLDEAFYSGEEAWSREMRKYESTYMVWANYEVAGGALDVNQVSSSSQLAAQVLYRIGAPLTDRQKADLVLAQAVPAVGLSGYAGSDGLRYALDPSSPYYEMVNQMQTIQYLEFASKVQ